MANLKGLVVSIEKNGWAKVVTEKKMRAVVVELRIVVTQASQAQR
jgi:hypothetical protein